MATKYDPQSYRVYLRNSISSKTKHILVEGRDDKYLIDKLCKDFLTENNQSQNFEVLVDSAESLIQVQGDELQLLSNNREKVEFIANSVYGQPYADGFVGFIDRELHKFKWDCDVDSELQDLVESHEIIKRLVRSRGHSIENYIFDLSILYEVLESLSTTVYANQAIELFKESFQHTLRIACSIGLAATKAQVLSKISSTIEYKLLEITSTREITFNLDNWIEELLKRQISASQAQDIRLHYATYNDQVSRASISLVRWICHGHIGYDFLRALYERCVFDSCPIVQDKTKEVSGISWVAKEKLLSCFINSWIKKSLQEQYEYPIAIFELLKITS
ncbi:DUF4435 domain-containing protein [Microcoleus sp. FACHB-68]|uniref:DUF4435 domain-containing protein n=1 Tax=Microcoleus sp. FACHB-68 TaxID=2692826 RepID=UPI001689433B|nr:DUF4435 domain-containing protein [Microcoleus sp. FACHB-68]MBD1938896.1 DUF4435 domain-containing protein [Microcoleus sp. FACHB-68]